MRNYNQEELKKMQEDAINRVRDMQRRSNYVVDSLNKELEGDNIEIIENKEEEGLGKNKKNHVFSEEYKNKQGTVMENINRLDFNGLKLNPLGIFEKFNFENDHWLILAIIVLLWSEKGDIGIILALAYIAFM